MLPLGPAFIMSLGSLVLLMTQVSLASIPYLSVERAGGSFGLSLCHIERHWIKSLSYQILIIRTVYLVLILSVTSSTQCYLSNQVDFGNRHARAQSVGCLGTMHCLSVVLIRIIKVLIITLERLIIL